MTHDPNLNTPHAKQPNPHDRGLRDPQPKRNTLRSLGLKRIGDVVVQEDRPEIRGMVQTVRHLVTVEEVD